MSSFKSQIPQPSKRNRASRASADCSSDAGGIIVKKEILSDQDPSDASPKKRARKDVPSLDEPELSDTLSYSKFKPSNASSKRKTQPEIAKAPMFTDEGAGSKRIRKPTQKLLEMLNNPYLEEPEEMPKRPAPLLNRSARPNVSDDSVRSRVPVKQEHPSSPEVLAPDSDEDLVRAKGKGKKKVVRLPVIEVSTDSENEVEDSPTLKTSFRSILSPTLDKELASDDFTLDSPALPRSVTPSGSFDDAPPSKTSGSSGAVSDGDNELELLKAQIALLKAKRNRQKKPSKPLVISVPSTPPGYESPEDQSPVDNEDTPRAAAINRAAKLSFQDGTDRPVHKPVRQKSSAVRPAASAAPPVVLCNLVPFSKDAAIVSKPQFFNVSAVAPDLTAVELESVLAAKDFESFPPFANFSRIDASLIAYDSQFRLIWANSRQNAVGIMLGTVQSCSVIEPFASTAPNSLDTKWSKKITITPTSSGLKGLRAFLAKAFDTATLKASIDNGADLSFTTRKDGALVRGAGAKSNKKNAKYFSADSDEDSTLPWHAHPFPGYLEFHSDLPLYDARKTGFRFDQDSFDKLQSLPRFVWPGTKPHADLPFGSIVAVAYTANVFKSLYGQSPSKSQPSPGPSTPVASGKADLSLCLNIHFAVMLGQVPPATP